MRKKVIDWIVAKLRPSYPYSSITGKGQLRDLFCLCLLVLRGKNEGDEPIFTCDACSAVLIRKSAHDGIGGTWGCVKALNKRIKLLEDTTKSLEETIKKQKEQLLRFEGYFPALR